MIRFITSLFTLAGLAFSQEPPPSEENSSVAVHLDHLTDFPPLGEARMCQTTFEDGRWHKNPKPSNPDRADKSE